MWAPSGPPRQTYLCLSGKEALRKVLELGILKQLSGDRLEQLRAIEYGGKVSVTRGPGAETNCVGGDCEHGPRKVSERPDGAGRTQRAHINCIARDRARC